MDGLGKNAPNGTGTIRRCGLVGGSVSLWRWALRSHIFIYVQAMPSETDHFLLSSDQDVEFSATSPAPCLPVFHHIPNCHAPTMMIMG